MREPNGAVLYPWVKIGHRCEVGANSVIGGHGFGYEQRPDGSWSPKSHEFGVVIENDVHIGACACIDRGSWRDTHIATGTRIDNLVHIAHNVQIGRNCMIVAGAEVSGSVEIGDGAWIGPNACIRQRLKIGAGAVVGMGAVVVKDVPAGETWVGNPARPLEKPDYIAPWLTDSERARLVLALQSDDEELGDELQAVARERRTAAISEKRGQQRIA